MYENSKSCLDDSNGVVMAEYMPWQQYPMVKALIGIGYALLEIASQLREMNERSGKNDQIVGQEISIHVDKIADYIKKQADK